MTCERIVYPGGDVGWMCGERVEDEPPACSVCGRPGAEYLCDGPAPGGEERATCDAPLCGGCTAQTDPILTIPTDRGIRAALRLAAGNIHAPIGDPLSAPERLPFQSVIRGEGGVLVPEPHDYCPRCSSLVGGRPGGRGERG